MGTETLQERLRALSELTMIHSGIICILWCYGELGIPVAGAPDFSVFPKSISLFVFNRIFNLEMDARMQHFSKLYTLIQYAAFLCLMIFLVCIYATEF